MRIQELLTESQTLKTLCTVGLNLADADIELTYRGSSNEVGRPYIKHSNDIDNNSSRYRMGIRVDDGSVLDARYLYYLLLNLYNKGYWKNLAHGTTALVNIRKSDIENIVLG